MDYTVEVKEDVANFLHRLWKGGNYAYFWIHPHKHSIWFEVNGQMHKLPDTSEAPNIYFSIHPLKTKGTKFQRGKLEDVQLINALFCEFDLKDIPEELGLETFEAKKDYLWDSIQKLDPFPSVIVDSGGGFHCYFFLTEPLVLTSENETNSARDIQAHFVDSIPGADRGAKDLSRVFRVPGTLNQKPIYDSPLPVRFVYYDLERSFTLPELVGDTPLILGSDQQELLEEMAPESLPETVETETRSIKQMLAGFPSWLLDKLYLVPEPGRRSEHDFRIVCDLLRHGLTPQEIRLIFLQLPIGKEGKYFEQNSKKAGDGDRYLVLTVTKARERIVLDPPVITDNLEESVANANPESWHDPWKMSGGQEPETSSPIPFIIDDILTVPSLSVWYGPPESLKSMILMDMLACVATGQPWLQGVNAQGRVYFEGYKTHQSPVLWIDYDQGELETKNRYNAFWRGHELKPGTPFYYVSIPTPRLDLGNDQHIVEMALRVKSLNVKLVVIDNLLLVSGKVDENSNTEMARVMNQLRLLVELTGCSVIVIHHTRKPNGEVVRAGTELRGASSILASLDYAVLLEREQNSKIVIIRPTKQRQHIGFEITAEFVPETTENFMPDGSKAVPILHTAKFMGISTEDSDVDTLTRAEIKRFLAGNVNIEQTQNMLIDGTQAGLLELGHRFGKNTIRGIIKQMENSGELVTSPGPNRSTFYSLTDEDLAEILGG